MPEHKVKFNTNLTSMAIGIAVAFLLFFIHSPQSWGLNSNRENAVVQAVRKVRPAVVNISSAYEVRKRANPFSGFGLDPFFDSFFRDFFDPRF